MRVCAVDRSWGSNRQTGAKESSHRPADGRAEVPKESPPKTRLRQPLWCHRDERQGRLWNQQVGGISKLVVAVCSSLHFWTAPFRSENKFHFSVCSSECILLLFIIISYVA